MNENKNYLKLNCPYCSSIFFDEKTYYMHISRYHFKDMSIADKAKYLLEKPNSTFKDILEEDLAGYLIELGKYNNFKDLFPRQFPSFYEYITSVRDFEPEKDFDIFINKVIPWRAKHPKIGNCKELCHVIFDNEKEANLMYERTMLAKNPYHNHGGKFSPFSKKFVGYSELSDKEKHEKIKNIQNFDRTGLYANQKEYWLKQGYSEEEAKEFVHKRQQTFSKAICIEKYGKEKGLEIFNARQEKWQNTLNSKSPEEIERINKLKMVNDKSFSKISQKLFWILYDKCKDKYNKIYFAQLDNETNLKDESGVNHEYFVHDPNKNKNYFLDFYIKDNNKVIEFDGDYWHSEKMGALERDKERENDLTQLGYTILRIKECDFNSNPDLIIEQCIKFINS